MRAGSAGSKEREKSAKKSKHVLVHACPTELEHNDILGIWDRIVYNYSIVKLMEY